MRNELKRTKIPRLGRAYWFLRFIVTEDRFIPDERYWHGDEDDMRMLDKRLIYRNEQHCWEAAQKLNKMLNEFREEECNQLTE